MKKYHVHTTLSSKHWELLNKYRKKYGTQQKAIELALESLENGSHQGRILTRAEQYWMGLSEASFACIVQKDGLRLLLESADMAAFRAYVGRERPAEFALEHYYQKPLREFDLEEVVEGLVATGRLAHWLDTVDYADDGDHYTLKVSHSMGINLSTMQQVLYESVFRTCGVRTESAVSGKTVFVKAYKK